jgi:hypothetical protein
MRRASGGGATTSTEEPTHVPLVYHDSGAVGCRRYLFRGCDRRSGAQMAPSAALDLRLNMFNPSILKFADELPICLR